MPTEKVDQTKFAKELLRRYAHTVIPEFGQHARQMFLGERRSWELDEAVPPEAKQTILRAFADVEDQLFDQEAA